MDSTGDSDNADRMGKPKKKLTALGAHRKAMRDARAQLRRHEIEGWAWEAMYAMLARLIEQSVEALIAGISPDDI